MTALVFATGSGVSYWTWKMGSSMGKKTDVQSRGFGAMYLALLLPLACLGTSIVRVSLEEAVDRAEWIVSGDVVRNWCGWDSGHRFIWTFTEIAVREKWKGTIGSTVTVAEPGGIVDGVKLAVTGMVRYSPGEHVVVFLYRTPIGLIRTRGIDARQTAGRRRGRGTSQSRPAPR